MNVLLRRRNADTPVLGRLFSDFFNDPFFAEVPALGQVDEGTLALDVSEDESTVIVRASLPGFRKEDVEVEIHDGVLSIKATHTDVEEQKTETFYRRERRVGSLSRRVALPGSVVEGQTSAELKDGILTLRLPKAVKDQPKKISIT